MCLITWENEHKRNGERARLIVVLPQFFFAGVHKAPGSGGKVHTGTLAQHPRVQSAKSWPRRCYVWTMLKCKRLLVRDGIKLLSSTTAESVKHFKSTSGIFQETY